MKSIAIYIEGGGDTQSTLKPFRTGMSAFLKPIVDVVRQKRIRWRVIPCGGRQQAYDAFVDAVENEPDVFNVLLVDSEEQVATDDFGFPWKHVKDISGDLWTQPSGMNNEQCHLMVVCMEAWFLADPSGLKKHFGGNFDASKLPPPNQAETRDKAQIASVLQQSTRNTPAKEYKKIRDGAELLKKVNPSTVRKQCKWCDRLFEMFGEKLGVAI